jgi:hypothetical protein
VPLHSPYAALSPQFLRRGGGDDDIRVRKRQPGELFVQSEQRNGQRNEQRIGDRDERWLGVERHWGHVVERIVRFQR